VNGNDPKQTLPALTIAARSAVLLVGQGASLGLALWEWRSSKQLLVYVTRNELPRGARNGALISMIAGAALALLIAGALYYARRPRGLDAAQRLALRGAPFVLAGLVPLLFHWQLWVERDLHFLVLASGFVLGLLALVRLALRSEPVFAPEFGSELRARARAVIAWARARRWLPLATVVSAALAYSSYFSIHSLNTHYRIETSVYDLGVENNVVWHAVHWGPLFRTTPLGPPMTHLGYHQTYFSYVIGIVYRFAPCPETLLVVQAVMLGFAAVPLFFLAKRRLGPWVACLLATSYLLYAPLHGSNLYDFHYQPLGVFFFWLTLYFLEERRDRWAALSVLLTLSVREDMSALLAVIGAYLVLGGERPRAGLIVTAIGCVYFVVLKFLIMPRFLQGESAYINQYAGLLPPGESGFAGVLKTAFGNPGFTLGTLLEKDKTVYVLQLLAPLAFLPLRRPIGWLLLVPGFFFTLLSTQYEPTVKISFQYTAYWTPFVFIAAIAILDWIRQNDRGTDASSPSYEAWLFVLPVAMLVTSYQHGAVLQQHTARAHFLPYRFGITDEDRQRHDDLYALIAQVPPMARIVSSEWVLPHVSSRPDSYSLRDGVFDSEYMILSLPPRDDEIQTIRAGIATAVFGVMEKRGQFVLAKRGHDTSKNRVVLDALGAP
jgi:uncharacterized membrane protein